jgi:HEPN domain-containing protein
MPHDPVARQDALAWLAKADLDLRAARADLGLGEPLLGDAAFHCQQACEKALKATLALHDVPFRKTHDLGELASLVSRIEPDLAQAAASASPLTEYAWEYRYPGDVAEPDASEVAEALGVATALVADIRSLLVR